jgi:hypothetical protein
MASTLTSDMVRGSLRPFIERAEQPNGLSPDEARELLANHRIPVLLLETLWERTRRAIDRGVERRQALEVLRDLLDVLEQCIQAFENVRAKARAARLAPDELTVLEAAVRGLGEMRDDFSGLVRRLDALPPVDPSSLPAASGEEKVAGYIGLDDLAARLRSRGGV